MSRRELPSIATLLHRERARLSGLTPAALGVLWVEACGEVTPPSRERIVEVLVDLERDRIRAERSTPRIPVSVHVRPAAEPEWTAFH